MTPRRSGPVPALGLVGLGSVLALLAGVRPWLAGTEQPPAPLPPREVVLSAAAVAPGVRAVGLLGLAGVVAVLAARGVLRAAVGALLAAGGAAVVVLSVAVLLDPAGAADAPAADLSLREGPVLGVVAGLLLAGGGLLAAVRGRGWAGLGRRYEAPGGAAAPAPAAAPAADPAVADRALWESLDRGDDPTGAGEPAGPTPSGPVPPPRD